MERAHHCQRCIVGRAAGTDLRGKYLRGPGRRQPASRSGSFRAGDGEFAGLRSVGIEARTRRPFAGEAARKAREQPVDVPAVRHRQVPQAHRICRRDDVGNLAARGAPSELCGGFHRIKCDESPMIRTRFAPSPTGYLHVGGARTALFSRAYARKHGGKFVLRIEDTDLERSTEASVQTILDAMRWLGLDWDEGPFRQMQRLQRYREIAERPIREGKAYRCYCTREELDRMREAQRARGEKPRYDGRWRDSKATPPAGVKPVIRFKNPLDGDVSFRDLVKGSITIANAELDDVVLLREDGVPTYNFGVVVDDLDMKITDVIRGDDHVNNTPRQIHIFNALGAALPKFGHVPMILGSDGERLSKRHGAVSVLQYRDEGYLPEALLNYLARLGWSHGDDELFAVKQLIECFDLAHVSRSAAQFNPEKLAWLNQQYLKSTSDARLAELLKPKRRK